MANGPDAAAPAASAAIGPVRFESLGLSIPPAPLPGRSPVILIQGLWMGPRTWEPMIRALASDPEVAESYQFWTFGYATGDPIPYSASRLRAALDEVRRRLDPEHRDPALDRIVLVGHSMGGLVARLATVDSGDRLWRMVSDQPPDSLSGDPADVALARECLIFRARPDVRAVVYIATPHAGGTAEQRLLHDVARRFVVHPDPLMRMYQRLIDANPPDYFRPSLRTSIVTSIDEMRLDSPLIQALRDLSPPPGVATHSIIPVKNGPRGPGGDDGVVTYASAHLEGVDSETIVPCGHFCQDSPAVVAEVRRILLGTAGR
jgi:pimeloyl-ACP methyl ester carboxylesterase